MAGLRARLLEERQRLVERMETELSESVEPIEVPGDPAELACSTSAREESCEFGALQFDAVAQIDHVRHRMESGRYGICEDCGKRIPAVRLRIVPSTTLCVECKKHEEQAAEKRTMEAVCISLGFEGPDETDTEDLESQLGTIRGRRVA
jgi:DnaK suppressor protein